MLTALRNYLHLLIDHKITSDLRERQK